MNKNIKMIGCIITLNGKLYLKEALKSAMKYCDEIIIVEGSTKYAYRADQGTWLSSDGTSGLIRSFIDVYEKDPRINLHYIPAGKVYSKADLRNKYIEYIDIKYGEEDNVWVMVLDDDELYWLDDIIRLKKFIRENPKIEYIYNPQHWFWGDFRHECTIDEDEFRKSEKYKYSCKKFKDCNGNLLRQGQYHERIFKFKPGMHYGSHATISDKDGKEIYIDEKYEKNRAIFNCTRYHYTYVKSYNELWEKFAYFAERDGKCPPHEFDRLEFLVEDEPFMKWILGKELPSYFKVNEFKDDHPTFMKYHKLYNHVFDKKEALKQKKEVDEIRRYVVQQYVDILERYPEKEGRENYTNHIVEKRLEREELPKILKKSEEYKMKHPEEFETKEMKEMTYSEAGVDIDKEKEIHNSDCSVHNEPAYPNGECDCKEVKKDE